MTEKRYDFTLGLHNEFKDIIDHCRQDKHISVFELIKQVNKQDKEFKKLKRKNEQLKKSIKRQQGSNEECAKLIKEQQKENEQLKYHLNRTEKELQEYKDFMSLG